MKFLTCFTLLLMSASAFAGGSIFGGKKTSNPQGVSSIGIYICGSLNCPDVILKQGSCDGIDHASMQYGVCVCEEGYKVAGNFCAKEDKEYEGVACSDYITNKGCGGVGSGYYCQSPADDCTVGGKGVCHILPDGWQKTAQGNHPYLKQKTDWFTANSMCVALGQNGLITSHINGIPLNEPADPVSEERYQHLIKTALGTTGIFWTNYDANGNKTTANETTCGAYFVFTNDNYDLVADPNHNYAELFPLCE